MGGRDSRPILSQRLRSMVREMALETIVKSAERVLDQSSGRVDNTKDKSNLLFDDHISYNMEGIVMNLQKHVNN